MSGAVRGTFQRGCLRLLEDLLLQPNCTSCDAQRKVSANTSYRQARMNSRNLLNITIREARRQRRSACISLSSNFTWHIWKHCAELAEKMLNLYTDCFPEQACPFFRGRVHG